MLWTGYISCKEIQMIFIGNRMKSCSAVLFSVILRTMFFLLAFSAHAQVPGPAWWFARGVVNTNLHPNDYAPLNGGQLKWMATNAYDEMNAYFGAGTNVAAVVCAFSNSNNYYLVNIGQVKYVVQRFYDRLHELNLTNTFPANMPGSYYPWGNAPHTNDYAAVNIGQVKYVFSFDSSVDSDGDGYSDWSEAKWETDPYSTSSFPHAEISGVLTYTGQQTGTVYVLLATNGVENGIIEYQSFSQPDVFTFTNIPALRTYWLSSWRDSDGDGSNDFWEAQGNSTANPIYLAGNVTNANIVLSDPDSDGDGLPDWWEIAHGTDPFNPDTDGDGLSDGWEVAHGTDPLNPDTNGNGLPDGWEVMHGYDPLSTNNVAPIMREEARNIVISRWNMVNTTPIVFTNQPGSQADLNDIKNALNSLSGKFYKTE